MDVLQSALAGQPLAPAWREAGTPAWTVPSAGGAKKQKSICTGEDGFLQTKLWAASPHHDPKVSGGPESRTRVQD